jgi:hypothetical protein
VCKQKPGREAKNESRPSMMRFRGRSSLAKPVIAMATDTKGASRAREQVPTVATTAQRIVRSLYVAADVEDVRRGLPPRFDMMQRDVTHEVGNGQF